MAERSIIPYLMADGSIQNRSFPPATNQSDGNLYYFVVSKEEFEQARENQNIKVDDIFIWHKGRYAAIRALNEFEWQEAWHLHNIVNPGLPNQLIVISSFSYSEIFGRVQNPSVPLPDDWPDLPEADSRLQLKYNATIQKSEYETLSQEVKEQLYTLVGSKVVQLSLVPAWLLDKYHWPGNVHLVVSAIVPIRYNLIK